MYRFVCTNYGLFWSCCHASVLWGLVPLLRRPNQKDRTSLLWGFFPLLCCDQVTRGRQLCSREMETHLSSLLSCQGSAAHSSSWLGWLVVAGMCPVAGKGFLPFRCSRTVTLANAVVPAELQNRGGKCCIRTRAMIYQKVLSELTFCNSVATDQITGFWYTGKGPCFIWSWQ